MNIVIKEAEEKHIIHCINILQNSELGIVYFSDYKKAADLLLHAIAQQGLFVALNENDDCLGFMYFMPKGVFGSYPYAWRYRRYIDPEYCFICCTGIRADRSEPDEDGTD